MKIFIKKFKWFIIAIVAALIILGVLSILHYTTGNKNYERTNTDCDTTERVFDYADKLTDEQEDKLRTLIQKREKQIGCDIILVTMNEPIEGDIRDYTDVFVESHKFGYNKAYGDSICYLDNWHDGYTWLSTSGKAEAAYSNAMINTLINGVTAITNKDPSGAYTHYVNTVYKQMSGRGNFSGILTYPIILILSLLISGIYVFTGIMNSKTGRTTTVNQYVTGGKGDMAIQTDDFLTKNVTRRRISTSSGSNTRGGGGHHVSSGGRSHGGGGGRH